LAHTIDHPAEQMMALIATIIGGVFERFPTLRIAYLESGIGWVPYMTDRLEEGAGGKARRRRSSLFDEAPERIRRERAHLLRH
jgi:predicted TIM-barrel fold metal-dependent hydrolase